MPPTLQDKLALVTGATNGIGKITALELARQGAHVIIVGRSPAKTAAVAEELRRQSGSSAVDYLLADLAQVDEVRRLAEVFCRHHQRLDILVNNAGMHFAERQLTAEGYERTFALNHLAYFLLTNLLLEPLKAGAPARVVSVSSLAHRMVPGLDFDDLMSEKYRWVGFQAYARSKLANLLFTYELARRLEGSGVSANALHPGVVNTGFAKNNAGLVRWGLGLAERFLETPEQGAQTSIYLASSPEVEGVSGKYFVRCRATSSSRASYDLTAQQRLWQASALLARL